MNQCLLLAGWLCLTLFSARAQTSPAPADSSHPSGLRFSGYLDTYYAYDFNRPVVHDYTQGGTPDSHLRPTFLYNHNRHNEFNLNNAFLKVAYADEQVRANVALQAGTYAQYNYASEPALLRNVYEANAGVKLAKNLWLDAGIFASHIGSESAVSKDCPTLTRSLSAENTPYYLTGVKLSYSPDGSPWSFTGLVLNGWQRIRDNNSSKALGTQIQYKAGNRLLFNSSTFIGNEQPEGSPARMRYFHDFYLTFQASRRLNLMALVDAGIQRNTGNDGFDKWSSWVLVGRYQWADHWFLAARLENYRDPQGVIIASASTGDGFQTSGLVAGVENPGFEVMGYSLNLDYQPFERVMLRVEGRLLEARHAIFVPEGDAGRFTRQDFALTTSLAVSF